MNLEQFEQLMNELGPASDVVTSIVRYEDNVYEFGCDHGEVLVLCEFSEEANNISLQAAIGQPDEDRLLQIYDLMLAITGQAQKTGGVRMGLSETGGQLIQAIDLPASGLDLFRLQTSLSSFVARARKGHSLVTAT